MQRAIIIICTKKKRLYYYIGFKTANYFINFDHKIYYKRVEMFNKQNELKLNLEFAP